uniref:hypothetical protein n=1 Tax=Auritidibacter ignavus TaxID=678932 RepID=UPI001CB72973
VLRGALGTAGVRAGEAQPGAEQVEEGGLGECGLIRVGCGVQGRRVPDSVAENDVHGVLILRKRSCGIAHRYWCSH